MFKSPHLPRCYFHAWNFLWVNSSGETQLAKERLSNSKPLGIPWRECARLSFKRSVPYYCQTRREMQYSTSRILNRLWRRTCFKATDYPQKNIHWETLSLKIYAQPGHLVFKSFFSCVCCNSSCFNSCMTIFETVNRSRWICSITMS